MVLSVNIMAALITVLVRDVYRRLTHSQVPSLQMPVSGVEIYSTLAFLVSGLYFYLIRNTQENVDAARSTSRPRARLTTGSRDATSISSENRVASQIEKAKFWVNNHNFQGSKTLQQQALRCVTNAPLEYPPTLKTDQNTSKFVPRRNVQTEGRHGRKLRHHHGSRTNLHPRPVLETDFSKKLRNCHEKPVDDIAIQSGVPKAVNPDVAVPGPSWAHSSTPDLDDEEERESVASRELPDRDTGDHLEARCLKLPFSGDPEKKLEELGKLSHDKARYEERRLRGKHVIRRTRSGKICGFCKTQGAQRRK